MSTSSNNGGNAAPRRTKTLDPVMHSGYDAYMYPSSSAATIPAEGEPPLPSSGRPSGGRFSEGGVSGMPMGLRLQQAPESESRFAKGNRLS